MRLATLLVLVVLVAAGCGSHHSAAERKRPPVQHHLVYVVKTVRPECQMSPFGMTGRQYRRWLRRCAGG